MMEDLEREGARVEGVIANNINARSVVPPKKKGSNTEDIFKEMIVEKFKK